MVPLCRLGGVIYPAFSIQHSASPIRNIHNLYSFALIGREEFKDLLHPPTSRTSQEHQLKSTRNNGQPISLPSPPSNHSSRSRSPNPAPPPHKHRSPQRPPSTNKPHTQTHSPGPRNPKLHLCFHILCTRSSRSPRNPLRRNLPLLSPKRRFYTYICRIGL